MRSQEDASNGVEDERDASDTPLLVGPLEDPDRYELIGPGIRGGEGTTWPARYRGTLHTPLTVAVKVLWRPPSAGPGWPTDADRRRWHDQTELLRHLHVEHLVRLHDVSAGRPPHPAGQEDEGAPTCAIVEMEWLDGETLARAALGRPATRRTLKERLSWIEDLSEVVAHLHSMTRMAGNPSLHRDLSPGNCMITPDRGVVLIDLAGMQLAPDEADLDGRYTPGYSAPEVVEQPHRPRLPSADRYAVGALAYLALTGEAPPPTPERQRARLLSWAKGGGFGTAFLDTLLSPLAEAPEERPEDLVAWSARLGKLLRRDRRRRARHSGLVAAGAALASAALLGAGAGTAVIVERPRPTTAPTLPALVGSDGLEPATSARWWEQQYPAFTTTPVTGTGNKVFALPRGAAAGLLTVTYRGASKFSLTLVDEKQVSIEAPYLPSDTVAGDYTGTRLFGLVGDGEVKASTRVSVETDGRWTVVLHDFTTLRPWPGRGIGDGVYRFAGGPPREVPYTQEGPAMSSDGAYPVFDLRYWIDVNGKPYWQGVVSTSGSAPRSRSSGRLPLSTHQVIVAIQATGAWTVG